MTSRQSVFVPKGDLTIFEVSDFKQALLTHLSQDGPVTLDLKEVRQIDTSAIQAIMSAHRSGRLTVAGIPDKVKDQMGRLGWLPDENRGRS